MKLFKCFCIGVILLLSGIAESQSIHQVGYYNGNGVLTVSSVPGYMYLSDGNVVNIMTPSSPYFESHINTGTGTGAGEILIQGNYIYYGIHWTGKIIIADNTDPANPVPVDSIEDTGMQGIYGMVWRQNVLYVASRNGGIYTVDISNLHNPVILDSIIDPFSESRGIVLNGNYAYVANTHEFKVFDISNPTNIIPVTSVGLPYATIDLDKPNNLIYIGNSGVDVYDISNPVMPAFAFSVPNNGGTVMDIKYRDNLLYVATHDSGMYIYKILGTSGVQMARFPNSGNGPCTGLALQDSLILLSTGIINGVSILKYDSLLTTGIPALIEADNFSIVPNPAYGYFEIVTDMRLDEVEIYDNLGKSVIRIENIISERRFDISSLPKGVYIIRIRNEFGSWSKKLIKSE